MNFLRKITLIFCLIISLSKPSFAAPSRNLTIFAEPNLVMALTKIVRIYSKKSNVIISVNFNSSIDLIGDIDYGEPVDIFLSAHHDLINSLRQKGLVDIYNIGYFARDELALIASKSNSKIPVELLRKDISLEEALKILNHRESSLIVDNEENSSGKASNEFLERLGFTGLKIFKKLNEDKSPILGLLRDDNKNYALLLASQVNDETNFQILAKGGSDNIFYQALVIAGDNMEIAREFLKFLKSKSAQEILRQSGFIVG